MTDLTPQQILQITLEPNDANAETIGQYLFTLTAKLWEEEEGFDGKRPFGNSGWSHDILHALILNKVIDGELDEDGYIEDFSQSEADKVMTELFAFLISADYSSFALPPEPKHYFLLEFDESGNIVDSEYIAYTKGKAEERHKDLKNRYPKENWRIVHIPQ